MKKIFRMMMAFAIAAFTFTACEDVPEPYNNPYDGRKATEPEVTIDPTGSGTKDDPWNVAAVIAACNGLADTEFLQDGAEVYVKGIVTETTEISTQFGNATYYISDDAKGSNRFYVYRGKLLDNASVASDDDLQVGDEVVVCGKVKNYKGTMEFDQGNYLVSLKKGEGGGETTAAPGTLEKPLTVPEALAYIDGLGADKQSPTGYVKGKIAAITEVDTGQYGNATYLISDDGTENVPTLQIYRGYSLGGEKFQSANEIKVGDEVIITGKLVNFKGNTKQFAQGSSIYSLNGKIAGGGGGSTDGEAKGDGTLANPFNPVAANIFTSKLASGAKSDNDVYIKGKISKIANNGTFGASGTYGNASFYNSEDGTEGSDFYVFRTLYLGNTKYSSGTDIKVGDEVIICGKVTNYMGNTPETSANESYIYSLNGQTAGGGETPTPTGEVKKVTVAEFIAAPESTTVWYQLTGTVKNLQDGDQYGNFDLEDATGSVYVYGVLSEKGGAKKQFQELAAAKGIVNGCTITIIGNRGSYNDKIEVTNAYFVSVGEGGGEVPPTPQPTEGNGGVLEGNTLTVVYADLGVTDLSSPIKLVDGTTLTFSKEDGKNNPIYHESSQIVRMYAHNSVTVNAGNKRIASVVFNYDTYQGTAYCGNDALYGEAAGNRLTPAKDDKTVTFSNVNASILKVVNDFETNSGGVQFRCTGLVVTFAE